MALQASGAISVSQINTELGYATTTSSNLGQKTLRNLAQVASGAISMSNFYSKSNVIVYYNDGTYSISLGTPTKHGESGCYMTVAGTYVRVYNNNDMYVYGGFYWTTPVNLTNVNQLRFKGYSSTTATDFVAEIRSTIGGSAVKSVAVAHHASSTYYYMDVSGYTGNYYIYFNGYPRTQGRQINGFATMAA